MQDFDREIEVDESSLALNGFDDELRRVPWRRGSVDMCGRIRPAVILAARGVASPLGAWPAMAALTVTRIVLVVSYGARFGFLMRLM